MGLNLFPPSIACVWLLTEQWGVRCSMCYCDREVEKGHLIDLRLTHQEIAEILGITRVTVTRLLREFEQQGAIARLPHKFIVLRDRDPFWYYEI
jgi:hypothetical protein